MNNASENDEKLLDENEREIISAVAQRLSQQLCIIHISHPKDRPRARKVIIVKGTKGKYFVELAKNDIQKFYLKRAIHYSGFFKEKIKYATINLPIITDESDGVFFTVFAYLSSKPAKPNLNNEKILKALYKDHSFVKKICVQSINEIETDYLNSWPEKYHNYIRYLPEYLNYLKLLRSFDEISLCPEHGDFALNNILTDRHSTHLIDFEFSRENQVVGFDLYAYRRTTYKTKLLWNKRDAYTDLHGLRFNLNDRINFAIDNNLAQIIVYTDLQPWLKSKILNLMGKAPFGNDPYIMDLLSPQKSGPKRGNGELFFVTIWHEGSLSGVAAFRKRKKIVYPIITAEGMPVIFFNNVYQFGVLIKYLEKSGVGFHLDNISKQSEVYKQLTLVQEMVKALVNSGSMPAGIKQKLKDRALAELLHEITRYLESVVVTAKGSDVLIYNRRNRKIKSKYLRNRFLAAVRLGSRTIRAGIFIMSQQVSFKRFLFFLYQYPKMLLQWRKSRKKGGALLLRIGDFHAFTRVLNQKGVEYAVLRGLHDGNPSPQEDVVFMLKASHIKKIIRVAAFFPGLTPCCIYFDTYQSVEAYPYYPPAFALKILESREKNKHDCYVPDAYYHLMSLLFHITYHKGLTKGFDCDNAKITPESKYYETVLSLIEHNGLEGAFTLSLDGFHEFLKKQGASMPYDMLVKWPKRNQTIDAITKMEERSLREELPAGKENLIAFIIRKDADHTDIIEYIKGVIDERFSILFFKNLTRTQIDSTTQFTRGGNWVELDKKQFHLVAPYSIIVCAPKLLDTSGNHGENYAEACAGIKKAIRRYVNDKFASTFKRYLIHSTDSPCEALDYLKTIFPETYTKIIYDRK